MIKRRQKRKFKTLQEKKIKEHYKKKREMTARKGRDQNKVEVVDLTKQGIGDEIKSYLSLGPDFCEAPTRVPY